MIEEKNFWSYRDIQEHLNVSPRTAKALIKSEGCPALHFGKQYRVQADKFMDWLETTKDIKLNFGNK